jgi:hypothetical protein
MTLRKREDQFEGGVKKQSPAIAELQKLKTLKSIYILLT